MWRCSKCGETLQDAFEACWKCGTTAAGAPTPGFQPEPDDPAVADPGPMPKDYEDNREPAAASPDIDAGAEHGLIWHASVSLLLVAGALVGCGIATHRIANDVVFHLAKNRSAMGFSAVLECFFFLAGLIFLLFYLLIRPPVMGRLVWALWVIGLVAAVAAVLYTMAR